MVDVFDNPQGPLDAGLMDIEATDPNEVLSNPQGPLDQGLFSVFSVPRNLVLSNPQGPLDAGIIFEITGPYVRDRDPAPEQMGVPRNTNVLLNIAILLPSTINSDSIMIRFSVNGGPFVLVYMGGFGFQPGYTGTALYNPTAFEDVWEFNINPLVDFPALAMVTVNVEAYETADPANDIEPPEFYRFFIEGGGPPPPSPTPPFVFPNTDTIRGGKQVFVGDGTPDLGDTSADQTFKNLDALPSGWTATGQAPSYQHTGVLLRTLPVAASFARLTRTAALADFDAAVDYAILGPQSLEVSHGPVALAGFRHICGSSGVFCFIVLDGAEVRIVVNALAAGQNTQGGSVLAPMAGTMRIVRNGPRVWVFLGDTELLNYARFVEDTGTLNFEVLNLGQAVEVSTVFSNFTIAAHARIGPRLLDKKQIIRRHIVGNVPAATLPEVGLADVTSFGLFGSLVQEDGFLYTLPIARTFSASKLGALLTYQDPTQKDGR